VLCVKTKSGAHKQLTFYFQMRKYFCRHLHSSLISMILLSLIMLSVVTLCVAVLSFVLSVVLCVILLSVVIQPLCWTFLMLSVCKLNVVMLGVIMLSVIALNVVTPIRRYGLMCFVPSSRDLWHKIFLLNNLERFGL